MTGFVLRPASAVDAGVLHALFGAAFADYLIGPFKVPLAGWPHFLGGQGVDLHESRVAFDGDEPIAFVLVAPRADIQTWRLATAGALPAARGNGAAPSLVDDFISRAAGAGMRQVELECFAQNGRALALYRKRGFTAVHELHGYVHAPDPAMAESDSAAKDASGQTDEIGLAHAFAWLDALAGKLDLAFQVTGTSLRARPTPLHAWRLESAQLVFTRIDEAVQVVSLVDTEPAQANAQLLVTQLVERFPHQRISVPQLQRSDLGGEALERAGFERQPLYQLMMRRPL